MKIFILLTVLVFFCSCSTTSNSEKSISNRIVASNTFDLKNLRLLIEKTKTIFPKLGNPRYYLFEHFVARSSILLSTSSNDQVQDQNILGLISAYKVMVEAGIYLNFSYVVNPDNNEVAENLQKLQNVMNALTDQYGLEVLNLSSERLSLVKYLTRRISRNYQTFMKNNTDKANVRNVIQEVLEIKPDTIKTDYRNMLVNKNFLKAKKILSNLNLPEVGDIDGSDDAFEKVMSVQISMEMINWLVERELRN